MTTSIHQPGRYRVILVRKVDKFPIPSGPRTRFATKGQAAKEAGKRNRNERRAQSKYEWIAEPVAFRRSGTGWKVAPKVAPKVPARKRVAKKAATR